MKCILSLFLVLLMLATSAIFLHTAGNAADRRKLYATVCDGNVNLLPADYKKTLKKLNNGKQAEVLLRSDMDYWIELNMKHGIDA